ncbi:DUF742 domain-containing protein [Kineosporia sp. A_224]|uniref:DUF742 domain-containing protein n=1 Tax=Kineosporia sp. A_224 TaxID=1962180 RepID=UPI000B4B014A|nr:DUF742 domain-containing protein [Kineosporia sp. A_224]
MTAYGEHWYDEDAGPLVRPYALTHGRTRATALGLDLVTLVVRVPTYGDVSMLPPEALLILDLCIRPLSVVELSARLRLPVVVVKVLLGDLIESGLVLMSEPADTSFDYDSDILQAVLDGLRSL